MHRWKITTPMIALVVSVLAEAASWMANWAFGDFSVFGSPLNLWSWTFFWFHMIPMRYSDSLSRLLLPDWLAAFGIADALGWVFFFGIAILQWLVLAIPCIAL